MKRNIIILCAVWLVLSNCTSLTKSQVDSVKKYAETAEKFSDYPGKLITEYIDLQYGVYLLTTPLNTDIDKAPDAIKDRHALINKCKSDASAMDLSFRILKSYAANLKLLATTDYALDFDTNVQSLIVNMDTLIGTFNSITGKDLSKFGTLAYKAISFAGEKYIENERAIAIKAFVEKGNVLVCEMGKVASYEIENKIKNSWLSGLDGQLKANHLAIRKQILKDTQNYTLNISLIRQIDQDVIQLYDKIDYLNNLTVSLLKSIDNLCVAHTALNQNIKEKKKLDDILTEVKGFYSNIQELVTIHNSLKTN
jgi:hypothetical protein